MKFLALLTFVFIILNIILCPIVSNHLSAHEGCMAGFVNHIEDMQGFLFAMISVFVFSIIFAFIYFSDVLNLTLSQNKFLYIGKILIPCSTKVNWLSILFHPPPCFR